MDRRTSPYVWSAVAGTGLQIVGLTWDAALHRLDPGLAAREGVFRLDNPSHLAVVLGLGLTVLGLSGLLALNGWRRRDGRRRIGQLAGAATISALFVGMAVFNFATGGLAGQHVHPAVANGAADAREHSPLAAANGETSDPTLTGLITIARERGTGPALTRLEEIATADSRVRTVAHDYAHAIGRFSFHHYGSAPTAFGNCRETFQSGCYHGVLEAYLESNPHFGAAEVVSLCEARMAPEIRSVVKFQCLHGLGHGLTMNFKHDIIRALELCDALKTSWDRSSCYGGVFMENIIFVYQQRFGPPPGQQLHVHAGGHKTFLREHEPLYPCTVLAERYKPECYLMQTSAVLMFNSYDFKKAFQVCDGAGGPYVNWCYQSMGRDASGYNQTDAEKTLELCALGNPAHIGHCYVGAAKHMIDVTWKIDTALGFCSGTPAASRAPCYTAIGEQLAALYPDHQARSYECARVEPDHVLTCTVGAGLTRPS